MTPVRTRSRWLRLVAALALVVAAFVYGVLPSLVSAKHDVHLLGDASVPLLVLAFLLEVTALATYTGLTRAILPAGLPVGWWTQFAVDLVGNGASHALPGGGATASALRYRLMRSSGIGASASMATSAMQPTISDLALGGLYVAGVVSVLPQLHGRPSLLITAAATAVVIVGAVVGAVVAARRGTTDLEPSHDPAAGMTARLMRAWAHLRAEVLELLRDDVRTRRAAVFAVAQLAVRRGLPVDVPVGLRRPGVARPRAHGVRLREPARPPAADARRPGRRGRHADPTAGRVRGGRAGRGARHADLATVPVLAPGPGRRPVLPRAQADRPPRPSSHRRRRPRSRLTPLRRQGHRPGHRRPMARARSTPPGHDGGRGTDREESVMNAQPREHGTVVVGVDGSERGLAGVRYAAQEALRLGVRLDVVHVSPGYLPEGPLLLIPDGSLQSVRRASHSFETWSPRPTFTATYLPSCSSRASQMVE